MSDKIETFLRHACLAYSPEDEPARFQVARSLLASDVDMARADIYTAAASGHVTATEAFILKDPTLVNQPGGPFNWPPLLYQAYSRVNCSLPGFNSLEVARLLLHHGADANAHFMWGDTYRFTALTGAFGEGEQGPEKQPCHPHALQLAELLLQAGADPNDGQALYNRMFTPGHDCLELLLRYGLNATHMINWQQPEPMRTLDYQLLWASNNRHLERARLLLHHGADPNLTNDKAMPIYRLAVRSGCREMADLLAQNGAEPDLQHIDLFLATCLAGDAAEAKRLLDLHPHLIGDLAPEDTAALHTAAGRGDEQAVALMLDLGFPVNAREPDGNHATALHQAAAYGHLATARLLLANGASVRLRDTSYSATPLNWADHHNQPQLVAFLLEGDIDIFDAVCFGEVRHVRDVLRNEPGAAVALLPNPAANLAPDREQSPPWITPLHFAARQNKLEAATVLLAHGADPNGTANQEQSPFALAEKHGHEQVASLLREHGANS